ncbi:MAG TPA: TMEM175 family protein [Sphingomonas sp.]|nr:TMEM175 family protein [Sphingomonas sp.]
MSAEQPEPEHTIERLIFFSDAVFAIAITLLIIEIHVPELERGAGALDYVQALAYLIPNFVGFLISFFVIGAFWAGHHRAFACAVRWSDRLVFPNLLMLCAIAAMPFFTAFVSANPNARVPVAVYCGWLLVTGFLNMNLQRVVLARPVVSPVLSPGRAETIRRRGLAVVLGAATAVLVAIVSPVPALAEAALVTIPLWRKLLDRRAARAAQRVGTGDSPE